MVYYLIALVVVALDQLTKWLVVRNMTEGQSITVIENLFYITSHRNQGAAWGILQGQMWFFYIITIGVIIGIVYYLEKQAKGNKLFSLSLALLLGGAIGNFIDRLFRKEVVDFLNTYIFQYDFPIFNIADAALTIGVGMMVITMLLDERREKKEKLYGNNGTYRS
ncbi:lipoprotein signal peptidase [Rossellomorea vietnamensis]|uniref:Lipoprotein signal peptidase n=1 Tax=Rossellomorea vietnamensis TaxID=218284 RepID=A0A5D4NRU3_9BACI|nr:signal peptidase II [Rossellomorea vietnamensis]TYS16354.1 lipoprotein signal peptidase [Rossellomorea vietnamensis]